MPHTPDRGVPVGDASPSDESLIDAAGGGLQAGGATQTLWERYHRPLDRFVGWWARCRGLQRLDRDEARQEAALAFLRAVTSYRAGPRPDQLPASFRTFLLKVVRGHLGRWLWQYRRPDRLLTRALTGENTLLARVAGASERGGIVFASDNSGKGDPIASASHQEDRERLAGVLAGLASEDRWLWEQLTTGRTLKALAAERGVHPDRLRRRKQRLLRFLAKALAEKARPRRRSSPRRNLP